MRCRIFKATTRSFSTLAFQNQRSNHHRYIFGLSVGISSAALILTKEKKWCEAKTYTRKDIANHSDEKSLWVHYQGKVYDVTEFAESHPGGIQNLLLAAGGDLEPFWNLYQQHHTKVVYNTLSEYYIGDLDPNEIVIKKNVDISSPYGNEPDRHVSFKINKEAPFNGEPPQLLLKDSFITPNELHFIRNRLPVPDVKLEDFKFELKMDCEIISYTLDELKSIFDSVELPVTIQCAGNRRSEFNEQIKEKKVNGLTWGACAISTAKWKGVLVSDILAANGITYKNAVSRGKRHLQAEGLDKGPDGVGTGSSIPLSRAFDPEAKVMLAYEMNGNPIPRDHGYPLRLIVPGTVGARQIKWLTKLELSHDESHSATQRRDYKYFGSNIVNTTGIPWETTPSVQYLPVTSAILDPASGKTIETEETITFTGYAYSGGGNGIIRVDISFDGGKSWDQAELFNVNNADSQRSFAWSLWSYEFTAPITAGELEVCVRAVDSNCNTQPDTLNALWNIRGLLNNSWHRISLNVRRDDTEED